MLDSPSISNPKATVCTVDTTYALLEGTPKQSISHIQVQPENVNYLTSLARTLHEKNIIQPSLTLTRFDTVRHKLKESSNTGKQTLQPEYKKLSLLIKNKVQQKLKELENDRLYDEKLHQLIKKLLLHEWKTEC